MFKGFRKVLDDSIKGPNGTSDPVRILFAVSGTNGVIMPVVFQIWAQIQGGADKWDVAAWCLAYGGMIGAIVTAGGLVIGRKDRDVATAQATLSDTTIKEGSS